MPRLVSIIVLVVIVLLIGALFIQVMAQFLVPIFLAVVLAVIFYPVYCWMVPRCQGREWAAGILTTLLVMVIVLLPLTIISIVAVREALDERNQTAIRERVATVPEELQQRAEAWGVEVPPLEELGPEVVVRLQRFLAPAAVGGVQLVVGVLFGLAIMAIALYYFLVDGPKMIDTAMRLSPLDDRYEQQLIQQFGMISRAVVLSTLLSAAAQGLLAGLGYWIVGLHATFLLMVATGVLAMVPFVGAAAVWIPCALWLWLWEDRLGAALFLAIYGGAVVSMADNVIKPFLLAGRANLHPLLALLSVLGGVQALGPIGIIVGPMAVSFLQALLIMLRTELEAFSKPKAA